MAKFLICFRVEQLLSGSIEVEAESAAAAREAFDRGDYDEPSLVCPVARTDAKLELEDSEDSIAEIQAIADA